MKIPNKIILLVVDDLRHDAARILWPYFNIIFTQHYTSNNWTLPVMARMLTGMLDTGLNYYKKMFSEEISEVLANGLKVPTIGKFLKDDGWITYSKNEGIFVGPVFGFGKSSEWDVWDSRYKGNGTNLYKPIFTHDKKEFRFYHDGYVHDYLEDGSKTYRVMDNIKFGKALAKKVKVYYANTLIEMEKWERDYWARAANLWSILDWIPKSDALVILTSDHGETFHEYYNDHTHAGSHMVEEVARVPLLIHWPEHKRMRVSMLTRDIDVAPTILDFAGIKQTQTDGLSLIPLIEETKKYKSILTDHYVHRSGELWKYYFSPTEKKLSFVKKL